MKICIPYSASIHSANKITQIKIKIGKGVIILRFYVASNENIFNFNTFNC